MKCPIDNETLVISERKNIEIDYCPKCRGVWLDRGELDKLVEAVPSSYDRPPSYDQPRHDDHDRGYDSRHHDPHYKKRKKESFLGDIFDF